MAIDVRRSLFQQGVGGERSYRGERRLIQSVDALRLSFWLSAVRYVAYDPIGDLTKQDHFKVPVALYDCVITITIVERAGCIDALNEIHSRQVMRGHYTCSCSIRGISVRWLLSIYRRGLTPKIYWIASSKSLIIRNSFSPSSSILSLMYATFVPKLLSTF